jgi:hypothetical protein
MPNSSGAPDEPLRKKRGQCVSRYVRSFCCGLILRSDHSRVGMTGLLQLEPDEDVNEIESGLAMILLKGGPIISSREHSRCGGKRGYRRNDEKSKIKEQNPSDDLLHHSMLHGAYYNTSVFTCKYESALQGASHCPSAGFWSSPWPIGVGFVVKEKLWDCASIRAVLSLFYYLWMLSLFDKCIFQMILLHRVYLILSGQ